MADTVVEQQLGAFTADPGPELRRLRQNGTPLLLKDGPDGDVIVLPADQYRRLRAVEDQWEAITAVKEGLADVANGRTRPAREVLAELASKHQLPAADGG
jgi:hypothetical protein